MGLWATSLYPAEMRIKEMNLLKVPSLSLEQIHTSHTGFGQLAPVFRALSWD